MESKKLEKKIKDWASDLSFKLPDGSAPPANYFALLTATPHRRRLWEMLIESVQPRQKIENLRKQIVVAKLRDRNKLAKKCESSVVSDRIDLWHKQCLLENQVKEKRNETTKMEKKILTKVFDVIYEICKLSELERLYEESSGKALALRLFTRRQKNVMKILEEILANFLEGANSNEDFAAGSKKENIDLKKDELFDAECLSPGDYDDSAFENKVKDFSGSEMCEHLWKELIKRKKTFLNKLAQFLKELKLNEKNILRAKETEVERNLKVSVTHMKWKVTEKALQVILNSLEGQALDQQMEKQIQVLLEGTFSEGISLLERSDCFMENEKVMNLRKCLRVVGLKGYEEYLREEGRRLDEEMVRSGGVEALKDSQLASKTSESVDTIISEIYEKKLKGKELALEILRNHENLHRTLELLKEETEVENQMKAVEDAEKLKSAPEKQIALFMETPLDAFKTIQSSSGRLLFECESLSHCLKRFGGELKQFFSAMLILPEGNSEEILSEVERRKEMLKEIRNLIQKRERLAQRQKEIQQQIASIKLDKGLCERNFKESDGVLWNVLSRNEELQTRTDFIEKILKNWVEQPYRLMVMGNPSEKRWR